MRKHALLGWSGQVSVAKKKKTSPVFRKHSRCYSASSFFRLRADSFTHGTNLKLQQSIARAQTKVAQARAQVCRGLATPLSLLQTQ